METFKHLKKVKRLIFNGNQITTIDSTNFEGLASLEEFNLRKNIQILSQKFA